MVYLYLVIGLVCVCVCVCMCACMCVYTLNKGECVMISLVMHIMRVLESIAAVSSGIGFHSFV